MTPRLGIWCSIQLSYGACGIAAQVNFPARNTSGQPECLSSTEHQRQRDTAVSQRRDETQTKAQLCRAATRKQGAPNRILITRSGGPGSLRRCPVKFSPIQPSRHGPLGRALRRWGARRFRIAGERIGAGVVGLPKTYSGDDNHYNNHRDRQDVYGPWALPLIFENHWSPPLSTAANERRTPTFLAQ